MWILFFLQWAHSTTVLVKAPQTDIYAYQVFLENSDNTRPSDIDLPCPERYELENYSFSANDYFLNGSIEKAKEVFVQISDLQWSCDWKPKEREIIFESLLRLSQIPSSEGDQKKWMRSAVEFDPQGSPNSLLFPPPFVKDFEDTKKSLHFQTLSLAKYYDTYVKVYRNGRAFSVNKKHIKIPNARARFTFVSDSHKPQTIVSDVSELQKKTIESSPYIHGDCKSFQFQKPPTWNHDTRLFFNPECIVESTSPSRLAETAVVTPSNTLEQQLRSEPSRLKPTWIERNYLWVGAALVGAVLISAEMSNRKQTQTVITPSNSADNR